MDLNLVLSAQSLCLAPIVQRSGPINGLIVLKNVPAKTYLRVTPEEWMVLQQFETPQTVPVVLGKAIHERFCLPLNVFYELILKAMQQQILLEPGAEPKLVQAFQWNWPVRIKVLTRPLILLFCVGIVIILGIHPRVPTSPLDWVAGLLLVSAALSFGVFVSACMIRGAGGEVYNPRWEWIALPPHFRVDKSDAITLPAPQQLMIGLAVPAALATSAGIAAWHRPEWAFFSLLGLAICLRPVVGDRVAGLIRIGKRRSPSDAEQSQIFPPNRRPEARGKLFDRTLTEPTTWARLAYGVAWTFAMVYWVARLGGDPPWTFAFWEENGLWVAGGIAGSLALLVVGYFTREMYYRAREGARTRRNAIRLWKKRWLGGKGLVMDEAARTRVLAYSPLFGMLPPEERLEFANAMTVERYGPWKAISMNGDAPARVSIIVSGKVSLRRMRPTGRTVHVQVLTEGDTIGLHDIADPKFPVYYLRTMTPVTLLTIDRAAVEDRVVSRLPQSTLTDVLLKQPFLRQISLCRNWHMQAINRFARLSNITAYPAGEVILNEGQTVEEFFIIFQGNARVTRDKRQLAIIHAGGFFGEIGLMQNSTPNASVTAREGTRCLSIQRTELLRFVTHNYTVALELERVSSERLGRPIFPLRPGDFRSI